MPDDPFMRSLIEGYLAAEPTAAFYAAFPQATGTRPYSQFLRNQFNPYFGGYMGAVAGNPTMTFPSYLRGQDPMSQWLNLAPQSRGERPGLFAPRLRWLS